MREKNAHFLQTILIVGILIIAAFFLHLLGRRTDISFFSKLFNFIRIILYISLFSFWGISVSQRVTQINTKKLLHIVAVLMIFWLIVREFKFRFVLDANILRYLWYSYYIPILLIPLLALFTSLCLGRPGDYQLPGWSMILSFLTAVFIVLVLTNDFHQLVFSFPQNSIVFSELDSRHEAVYYGIVTWVLLNSLAAFLIMLAKSRIARAKKSLALPMLPIVIAVLYLVLYNSNLPFIRIELGDFAVFFCLVSTAFFESCIQCGLIPSNSHYSDLFHTLTDTPIQIVDKDFHIRYSSDNCKEIPENTILSLKENHEFTHDGRHLHCKAIHGGYAIWTEDFSELLSLQQTLKERRLELSERKELLQYEYDKEKEHKIVEEQNRLYDLLQKKTQKQIDKINLLTGQYSHILGKKEKKKLLNQILVMGTYIKRRRDFILSEHTDETVSLKMLDHALLESFHVLKRSHIQGGFLIHEDGEIVSSSLLPLAYDFFEEIIESILFSCRYVNVRIGSVNHVLRINILTDYRGETDHLSKLFSDMHIEQDDDGTEFILPMIGGENR